MLPDNLMEITVLILRAIMIPMLLYNIWWSFPRFRNLLKGKDFFDVHYGSTVFLTCLPLFGFQLTALGDWEHVGNGPLTLMFILMLFLMNVVTIIGRSYEKKIGISGQELLRLAQNLGKVSREIEND